MTRATTRGGVGVTIPDLGHCAGSGAAPREGTVEQGDPATAVCAACSGRFPLTEDGSLSFHDSAALEAREPVGD